MKRSGSRGASFNQTRCSGSDSVGRRVRPEVSLDTQDARGRVAPSVYDSIGRSSRLLKLGARLMRVACSKP